MFRPVNSQQVDPTSTSAAITEAFRIGNSWRLLLSNAETER